jgi:UDP-glucuronate 4-epimerase
VVVEKKQVTIMSVELTNKKILVTGTAGFIGFHLANRLIAEGFEVVGLDSINDYYDVNLKYSRLFEAGVAKNAISYADTVQSVKFEQYRFIKLKLEDKPELDKLFKNEKFDYVINLAAQPGVRYSIENPYAYVDSNIIGFINILEACKYNKIKHLIYASSSSVYGLNEQIPFSTSSCTDHPMSLYAATKKSNELMAHTYSHLYQIPTTGLRFFTVYGPWGRPDMALFLFTKAAMKGEAINVYNYGGMMRDFTYVDDIVEGIFRAAKHIPQKSESWSGEKPDSSYSSAPYKVYNIGNNSPVKLMDFITAIENELGLEIKKNMLPLQAGDLLQTYANVEDLMSDVGYKPERSVEYGIKQFMNWYKSYNKIIKKN